MTAQNPTPAELPDDQQAAAHKAAIEREDRRVTSYDVALLAGVSQSAVSRCFKPGASVSKATFERVMKAAAGLDYIPNAAARSLITRRSNLVAVLISNRANLYCPDALSELSQHITRRGKRVLLFPVAREGELERVLSDVWTFQVDGVVAATGLNARHLAEFERRRVPLVLFNRHAEQAAVSSVLCDQAEVAATLVSRLAAAGHRQFAIIDGPADARAVQLRRRGAGERAAALGLPPPLEVGGRFDYASGALGLRTIIEQLGRLPDAVLCGNDVMAIGCLDTARYELGLDVPRQLSVAAFDAVEPSSWLSYNLTTLRQPIQKMALATADVLMGLINNHDAPLQRRVFSAQFVAGETARLDAPVVVAASVAGIYSLA